MPQSCPVDGCQPKPIVLRKPLANVLRAVPSSAATSIVAFSGLLSSQASHVDPTEMKSRSSGLSPSVRKGCCPPSGKSSMITSGVPKSPLGSTFASSTWVGVAR